MGSAAMMEETTRRRTHPSSMVTRTTSSCGAEIGSGGPSEESGGKSRMVDKRGRRKRVGDVPDTEGRRRRRRRRDGEEPPFLFLVMQVGTTLAVICLATFHVYQWIHPYIGSPHSRMTGNDPNPIYDDDDTANSVVNHPAGGASRAKLDDGEKLRQEQVLKLAKALERDKAEQGLKEKPKPTMPPLPTFELSDSSQWDAFGVVEVMSVDEQGNGNSLFWDAANRLREQFSNLYGGDNAARMLLDRGTTTFRPAGILEPPPDVVASACRLLAAKVDKRPFRLAFGGYSVTTGRGNRFKDSYPFQLRDILDATIKLAGIPGLEVTNAAIGGCPSFPYGWCMVNFWGGADDIGDTTKTTTTTPDIVSWDYSMNESSGGPEGLEAYVRHLLATYASSSRKPPKLIVKDSSTANQRKQLLATYAGLLEDTVVLHTDKAVQPFLSREEDFRPPGFQKWREWGAPIGAPGQALHHPAVQEHKLNGWILAMHLLASLEYMMAKLGDAESSQNVCPSASNSSKIRTKPYVLPPPVSGTILNKTDFIYDSILFGSPLHRAVGGHEDNLSGFVYAERTKADEWVMNPIKCRTTFQPILSGDMSEVVVSGTIAEDVDITLPKSQMYYNRGWTFDLSDAEKQVKRQLSLYPDGLGFVDSKEAYYGIHESPKLTLLLPHRNSQKSMQMSNPPKAGDPAISWYESVILCQVNEKSFEDDGCNFGTDVGVVVGGINVTANSTRMINAIGTVYLGKPICKHVTIPTEARLSSHNALGDPDKALKEDQIGLLVEVYVSNPHIVHIRQACSVSHVVWEERPLDADR